MQDLSFSRVMTIL